jgi:hypothetical protein
MLAASSHTHAVAGTGRRISDAPPERTEPNSLLNHETSDHLLSLVEANATIAGRPRNVSRRRARNKPRSADISR